MLQENKCSNYLHNLLMLHMSINGKGRKLILKEIKKKENKLNNGYI